jgi:hypothetical protein
MLISPPYGVMGKRWEVPLRVLTATHRLSQLTEMSCTLAEVAPRKRV